jgi:hypothetical protein
VYRRDAFLKGLAAAGYQVQPERALIRGAPDDVLVIWNRYEGVHQTATKFENEGGTVIVAENGYIANDRNNRTRYAIAKAGHNGSGWIPFPDHERFPLLGLTPKPWRTDGEHILVCPNRSFGRPDIIMPPMWPEQIVRELARWTKRPIRVRPHPGNGEAKVPLAKDLNNAWAVVIWSSSVGCEALLQGIPVFCRAPFWVGAQAATKDIRIIDQPPLTDRAKALETIAWSQWHLEEIEIGAPFLHLRNRPSARFGGM